jgi:hypothetical protein
MLVKASLGTRVELLSGFKFTGKSVKKWNLPVKLVKPVNGKGGKILRNRFFKKLLFVDYTLAAMNKYSRDMFFDIFEVSI